jgi:CelD/BcsL family acetyltransferase involved in cellulose biosynthesis
MKIEIYNDFSPTLKRVWEDLEGISLCTPFQSFNWLDHWQKSVGYPLDKIKPFIVVIKENNGVSALLPLGKRKSFGVEILEWLGGNNTDYMGPLISRQNDLFIKDFENIWEKVLKKLKPLDLVFLSKQIDFKKRNPFVSNLENKVIMNSYQSILKGNWDSYSRENLSKRGLSDSRRKRKRLSELGKLSFNIADNKENIKEITQLMIKQKSRRYIETGSWDMLSIKEYKNFYLNLERKLGELGNIHVSYLSLDNEIIATHWGLVSSDRFYYLMPTHEGGGWKKFSPGKLLLEFLIQWSLDNNLKIFDLTVGDEMYKKKWSNSVSPIYEHISPFSLVGKAYLFVQKLKEFIKRLPVVGKILKRIYNFFRK